MKFYGVSPHSPVVRQCGISTSQEEGNIQYYKKKILFLDTVFMVIKAKCICCVRCEALYQQVTPCSLRGINILDETAGPIFRNKFPIDILLQCLSSLSISVTIYSHVDSSCTQTMRASSSSQLFVLIYHSRRW
jgi:hypothetical protein